MSEEKSRWEEIRKIQNESATAYRILGGIALVGIGVLIGANLFADDKDGYSLNVYTEALGVVATVLIVDTLYRYRDERRRERELKDRLLREVRSPDNATARNAIHEIREHDWLIGEDGLLQGQKLPGVSWNEADLSSCNLSGASLQNSHLQKVVLDHATLEGATLWFAKMNKSKCHWANFNNVKMKGATLNQAAFWCTTFIEADLRQTDLRGADLYNATLVKTNLMGAYLDHAVLAGASFLEANLLHANLKYAHFDENTILPDCTKWTTETDMTRFTNPKHDEYWHSKVKDSPAHPDFHKRYSPSESDFPITKEES